MEGTDVGDGIHEKYVSRKRGEFVSSRQYANPPMKLGLF